MSWYEAAEYCNLLSEREGIPRDQWCYEPNKDGKYDDGMRVKAGHLALTGYRLPTEAEWEFACRAGATTARHYGRGEELLPRYEWSVRWADERAWPVGQLRPNDLGLFDALGNVSEWCDDIGRSYADVYDDTGLSIQGLNMLAFRGGSFRGEPAHTRSATRSYAYPHERHNQLGFRLARTLPPETPPEKK